MIYDVCIIGGGAAGLAAAASFNKNIGACLLEKNDIPGRKILATGGGRCNLTNALCPGREKTIEFFGKLGLELYCDSEGRYYPYTNRASDVSTALIRRAAANTEIKCGFTAEKISKQEDGTFTISCRTAKGTQKVRACRVILAMGGKAAPQFGTSGDGYALAKTMGHTVTRIYPILTGIECEAADGTDLQKLKGIRAKGRLTLLKDGRKVTEETGEIQFTGEGISGICVFNLTPYIRAEDGEKPKDAMRRFAVETDLAPDFSEEHIAGRKSSFGILTEKLAEAVRPEEIKKWRLDVTGVKGWKDAQATAGGIVTDEIDMQTMESRIVQGLYFAGEILDVQGPCGGFNLQNAWETGIRAAESVEKEI